MPSSLVTAGVDVGGPGKGFHAIALCNRNVVSRLSSSDPNAIADWCQKIGAAIVGVDAPICWSRTGRARSAERQLMAAGISCFSTPSEAAALNHPTDYYGWMRNGANLYRALNAHFSPYNGRNATQRRMVLETFPHAIACSLRGETVAAKNKRRVRRQLLSELNVPCGTLTNIDFIDAALCAVAGEYFAKGLFEQHGDQDEGYIVLPRKS
ncbi:MAG: DUF429 domain-containing protein [Steroidobacteraceae bacterium]